MEAFFAQYSGHSLYVLLFLALWVTGLGVPISEDLLVVLIGFLIQRGELDLGGALGLAYLGCLAGDLTIFNLGYHYGASLRRRPWLQRLLSEASQEKIIRQFRRYGDKYIMLARFLPGVRGAAFLTAGICHIKPWRFLLLDSIVACVTVPILLFLGYSFGHQWARLEKQLATVQWVVLALVVGAGCVWWFLRRRNKLKPVS